MDTEPQTSSLISVLDCLRLPVSTAWEEVEFMHEAETSRWDQNALSHKFGLHHEQMLFTHSQSNSQQQATWGTSTNLYFEFDLSTLI